MGKIDKSHIVVSGFHACTVPVGAPGFMADNRRCRWKSLSSYFREIFDKQAITVPAV